MRVNGACASVVLELGKEFAAPLRGHIEQTPQRIGGIAGAMMLVGLARRKTHLGAPEVADGTPIETEHIVDRLIPILAVGDA